MVVGNPERGGRRRICFDYNKHAYLDELLAAMPKPISIPALVKIELGSDIIAVANEPKDDILEEENRERCL
jgi:hypothetical protein